MADDLCLAYLLRGCLENCLGDKAAAEVSWNEVLKNEKGIILDHWIAPYARVELADLMINGMVGFFFLCAFVFGTLSFL
jgi:hypothetical protein